MTREQGGAMTRTLTPLASALILGWAVACSSPPSGAVGTSGQSNTAFVVVVADQLAVTVENRSGGPLLDVRIAIRPVGRQTEYTKFFTRMESSDKRAVSLSA